jgi:hypothetical protein
MDSLLTGLGILAAIAIVLGLFAAIAEPYVIWIILHEEDDGDVQMLSSHIEDVTATTGRSGGR